MLQNAKKLREEYIERVKEVADDIINVIDNIELGDMWEMFMDESGTVDILFNINGEEYEPDVDITEVFDYLSILVDDRISNDKTVIEALSEIFEIECTPWEFEISLKGYKVEEGI